MNKDDKKSNTEEVTSSKKKSKLATILITIAITIVVLFILLSVGSRFMMSSYQGKAQIAKAQASISQLWMSVTGEMAVDPSISISSREEVLAILDRGYPVNLKPLNSGAEYYLGYKGTGTDIEFLVAICPDKKQSAISKGSKSIKVTCNGLIPQFENVNGSFSLK